MLDFSTNMSYRICEKRLNRIRLKSENGIKSRTICNIVEREGREIQDDLKKQTKETLLDNGFTEDGTLLFDEKYELDKSHYFSESEINQIIKDNELKINEKYINPIMYEKEMYNISVDDVYVKKQKEHREIENDPKSKKQIRDTVVHIQKSENKMILNSDSVLNALLFALTLILKNGFKRDHPIVFFVDGEKKLHATIHSMFSWANYKIILDWPHLIKKCKECLSMGLKNSIIRNNTIDKIMPLLWNGDIESAIKYINKIPNEKIKNIEHLRTLIIYFERNKDNIPCYCLRKYLNLRNSSNLGEKANDLIVSDRQKKNGMSWSLTGSTSLASVCAIYKNSQAGKWLRNKSIDLRFNNNNVA